MKKIDHQVIFNPGRSKARLLTSLGICLVVVNTAYAQPQCDPKRAVDLELAEMARAEASVAERNLDTLNQLNKFLDSRKWKEGASIGSQMNAKEAETFNSLTERNKSGMVAALIESKRARDIRVLGRMARLADQTARYGLEMPEKKGEDYLLLGSLLAARELMPIKYETIPSAQVKDSQCTLGNAVILAAKDALKAADETPHLADVNAKATLLIKKYGRPLKAEKMSATDRRLFSDELMPVFDKVTAQITLAQDLMRLNRLNRVSELQLEARRQDHYIAPGDLKYSGKTWNEWVRLGRITRVQNDDSRIMNVINDKIPADVVKQWDAGASAKVAPSRQRNAK